MLHVFSGNSSHRWGQWHVQPNPRNSILRPMMLKKQPKLHVFTLVSPYMPCSGSTLSTTFRKGSYLFLW